MKKILLILLLAVCSLGFNARAYTAADLVGKHVAVMLAGTDYNNSGNYMENYGCAVEAGDAANQIVIKFFLWSYDLPVTVNDDGTLSMNFSRSYTCYGDDAGYTVLMVKRTYRESGYCDGYYSNGSYTHGTVYDYSTPADVRSTAISSYNNGDLLIANFINDNDNGNTDGFAIQYNNGTNNVIQSFGSIRFAFFDAPNTAIETAPDGTVSTYPVDLTLKDDGKVVFRNLFNRGLAYQNDPYNNTTMTSDVYGKIKDDGTITLTGGQIIGGTTFGLEGFHCASSDIFGTLNFKTYSARRGWSTLKANVQGLWEVQEEYSVFDDFILCENVNIPNSDVTGTWEVVGIPVHRETSNNWSKKHGGELETVLPIKVSFGTMASYSEALDDNIEYEAKSIVIPLAYKPIHHDADLNINHVWYETGTGTINADVAITNRVNCDHVKSYDLMVMPGKHTNISTFTPHAEKGHPAAIQLVGGIAPMAARSTNDADVAHSEIAKIATPGSDYANAIEKILSDDHTMFLRTNYTDDSGLKPTFHALSTKSILTGVENLEDIRAEESVEYYNMQGVRVANPAAGNTYIRRQGAKVEKIRF